MSFISEMWLERVASREVGGLAISIGTSLAIESAAGILPDTIVQVPPITTAQELWVNIRTLVRNMYGALDKETKEAVHPDSLSIALLEELAVIEAVVQKASNGKCKVVFYRCGYHSLPKKYPNAMFKGINTPKQITYQELEDAASFGIVEKKGEHDIRVFTNELSGDGNVALIITHCVVDLLARQTFASLRLLESHTGKVKDNLQWNSKLNNGSELTRIPFCKLSLQVFGDGVHFSPLPIKIKRFLLNHAEANKWTAVTKRDKMLYTLQHDRDVFSGKFFIALL